MDDGTRIKDEVRFSAYLGPLGRLIEKAMLRRRVTALLMWRNEALKEVAESDAWKQFLEGDSEAAATAPPEQSSRSRSEVEMKSHFIAH
jgi:hypothetical protein